MERIGDRPNCQEWWCWPRGWLARWRRRRRRGLASQLGATPSPNALMCGTGTAQCSDASGQFLPLCAHKDICHSYKSTCSHFDAQPHTSYQPLLSYNPSEVLMVLLYFIHPWHQHLVKCEKLQLWNCSPFPKAENQFLFLKIAVKVGKGWVPLSPLQTKNQTDPPKIWISWLGICIASLSSSHLPTIFLSIFLSFHQFLFLYISNCIN